MATLRAIALSSFLLLVANPAWGRVFLQWTEPAIPSARAMGVKELVIPWSAGQVPSIDTARNRGYDVYALVHARDAEAAAAASGLAGIIVESDSEEPGRGPAYALVQQLRRSHPGLSVLELDPGGKQPEMKGNLVVKTNGVLEVSSPTQQPWIDSNVALTKYERAFQPGEPPLFTFTWDFGNPLENQEGPRAVDYALAIAEAGAMHADLILPIHPNLQKALAEGNKRAWEEWNQVIPYIKFYSRAGARQVRAWADIAVVPDNYQDTYEVMNLFARHNISFQVLRPDDLTAQQLNRLQLVIVFSKLSQQAVHNLEAFSSKGGTAVLVNLHGPFPWSALPATKTSYGASYKVGLGKIVQYTAQVDDPEAFAEVIRGLRRKPGPLLSLWNALTTLALAYAEPPAGSITISLVNYAQEPLKVQVRVKGSFSQIRYETPEHGFYPEIRPEHQDGFTQFIIPRLTIGGRVYLTPELHH